jgi:CHAD domain-containing protein
VNKKKEGQAYMKKIVFTLPKKIDTQSLVEELSLKYRVKDEQIQEERSTYYDTFDWRLFGEKLVLSHRDGTLLLHSLNEKIPHLSLKIHQEPHFIKELPEGELKSELAPIVEMRALMSICEITSQIKSLSIINKKQVPVAIITLKEIECDGDSTSVPCTKLCYLESVNKGQKKYLKELSDFLNKKGGDEQKDDIFMTTVKALDIQPGSYSSKITVNLRPEMRADEASQIILRYLLSVIRANEEGIKKDIDSEFLHDFRVAVRRTRAFLSEIRKVFPDNVTEKFKKDFKFLGKATNLLRDLDVYLLNEEQLTLLMPPQFRDDIAPLFDYLKQQRHNELKRVVTVLNSQDYFNILSRWESFLNTPLECRDLDKNGCIPVYEVAQKRIYNIYHEVLKSGNKITDSSPDTMLHKLRIKCKRLRYVMEFFSSLYPKKKINNLIKQLKKLQDNLGQIQDLNIQVNELRSFAHKISLNSHQSRKTTIAIGILIGRLETERENARKEYSHFFKSFSSSDNSKLFKELFEPTKS